MFFPRPLVIQSPKLTLTLLNVKEPSYLPSTQSPVRQIVRFSPEAIIEHDRPERRNTVTSTIKDTNYPCHFSREQLETGKCIGGGGYADVYEGKLLASAVPEIGSELVHKEGHVEVAVKCFRVYNNPGSEKFVKVS